MGLEASEESPCDEYDCLRSVEELPVSLKTPDSVALLSGLPDLEVDRDSPPTNSAVQETTTEFSRKALLVLFVLILLSPWKGNNGSNIRGDWRNPEVVTNPA